MALRNGRPIINTNTILLGTVTPSGVIQSWGGVNAPDGWLICDGSEVNRETYATLFETIGTAFGEGDGIDTFNLPDLRGRFVRGLDTTYREVTTEGTPVTNNLTVEGHGWVTGQEVKLVEGALTGLTLGTVYYIIEIDEDTVAFALTKANAELGTKITISGTSTAVFASGRDLDSRDRTSDTGGNTGNTVGSVQEDAIRNITGTFSEGIDGTNATPTQSGAVTISTRTNTSGNTSGSTGSRPRFLFTFDASNVVSTGSDNRPSNIITHFIIKI